MRITVDTDDLIIVPQDIRWVKSKPPVTVVMWSDGVGTTVTCQDEVFDPKRELLTCIAKRFFGNSDAIYEVLAEWIDDEECDVEEECANIHTHQDYIAYDEKTIFDNIEVKRDLKDVIRTFITDQDTLELVKMSLATHHLPDMFFEALPMPDYLKRNFNMLPESVKEKTTRPILKIIEDMERAIYEY